MKSLTRRDLLGLARIAAGSWAFSSCVREQWASPTAKKPHLPWDFARLDPDIAADRAYQDYYQGHCMYGVFKSIVGQLAEQPGEPYKSFPFDMMKYGAGGVAGWGSLCGGLNGGAAVIGLFAATQDEARLLTHELFRWYEATALPIYVPKKPKLAVEMPKSVSNSVLCHVSVSSWCKVSGHHAFGKEHNERCARLTADTAKMTVQILDGSLQGQFAGTHTLSPETKSCKSCHARGGELENSLGEMSCTACHFKGGLMHPNL
jgi:hypothetical protein